MLWLTSNLSAHIAVSAFYVMSNSPGVKFNVRVASILFISRPFLAGPLTLSLR